jgi:putative transposase
VRRAYKFRLRPTARQHVALGQCLASHRELYNAALQERRDAWRLRGTGVSYGDQSAQLKDIRAARPDVAAWSFSSQQATLRRLNRAFAGFYRRVNAGDAPGYPRFRSAHRFDSVEWPKDGGGCRWQPDTRRVYLQGIGQVKVSVHRQVQGRVKTIQVCRDGRRWMLVLSCDQVPTRPLEPTRAVVGVDVGIASFATTSDGQQLPNPGYGRVAAARLGAAQQVLSRKQRGSNHRRNARATLAARHRKVANQRRNFHHHVARALVARYDLLVVEDLKIRNLVRRPGPASRSRPAGLVPGQPGRRQDRSEPKHSRRGLGPVRVDPARQSGRGWTCGDRRGPPAHLRPLRSLWAHSKREPRHTGGVLLSRLRAHRQRR